MEQFIDHNGESSGSIRHEISHAGWAAQLNNVLAAVPFGGTQTVPVVVRSAENAADSAVVTLRAASESDPTKSATATFILRR